MGRGETDKWWPETGLNRRRRPFQGRALPLSYLASVQTFRLQFPVRVPAKPERVGSSTNSALQQLCEYINSRRKGQTPTHVPIRRGSPGGGESLDCARMAPLTVRQFHGWDLPLLHYTGWRSCASLYETLTARSPFLHSQLLPAPAWAPRPPRRDPQPKSLRLKLARCTLMTL